jgi:membrane peptidoglycan carboxypeptidase
MEKTPQALEDAEYAVRTGGYRIYTTLDSEMQDKTQEVAANFRFNSDQSQCSAVFIDHHSGEIKVMIPGKEENNVLAGFNRSLP